MEAPDTIEVELQAPSGMNPVLKSMSFQFIIFESDDCNNINSRLDRNNVF